MVRYIKSILRYSQSLLKFIDMFVETATLSQRMENKTSFTGLIDINNC